MLGRIVHEKASKDYGLVWRDDLQPFCDKDFSSAAGWVCVTEAEKETGYDVNDLMGMVP